MRTAHDETVHLRLPRQLRQDLDAAARAHGAKLSVVARNALAAGLKAIRSSNDDRDPPPAAPAASLPVAA